MNIVPVNSRGDFASVPEGRTQAPDILIYIYILLLSWEFYLRSLYIIDF